MRLGEALRGQGSRSLSGSAGQLSMKSTIYKEPHHGPVVLEPAAHAQYQAFQVALAFVRASPCPRSACYMSAWSKQAEDGPARQDLPNNNPQPNVPRKKKNETNKSRNRRGFNCQIFGLARHLGAQRALHIEEGLHKHRIRLLRSGGSTSALLLFQFV